MNGPATTDGATKEREPEQACRHCRQPIKQKAKVCHSCGRRQTALEGILRFSEWLGFLVSLALLVLAAWQLAQARGEAAAVRDASEAAARAQLHAESAASGAGLAQQAAEGAEENARSAASAAAVAQADVTTLVGILREQVLLLVSATFMQLATKSEFGTERAVKGREEILADMNLLLRWAIPGEEEREVWIKALYDRIPAAPAAQ